MNRPTFTEPNALICQEWQTNSHGLNGQWVDFVSVKSADELEHACLAVEGKHRQFDGVFRIVTDLRVAVYNPITEPSSP